ncbi:hypothetical protein B0T20DRAFT_151475 [Sordaria brevicollis]|uniref:Uncharacterized protein n=1 Tax=Sordaria brevicollis TaxID=83679 RepID=A0AAE0PIZ2_SORBR|nr:hypothetical protein B0T20DRAFT_151475 [Sordaria brevicollis]
MRKMSILIVRPLLAVAAAAVVVVVVVVNGLASTWVILSNKRHLGDEDIRINSVVRGRWNVPAMWKLWSTIERMRCWGWKFQFVPTFGDQVLRKLEDSYTQNTVETQTLPAWRHHRCHFEA